MLFLITLAVTLVVVSAAQPIIVRASWVLYAVAALMDALYLLSAFGLLGHGLAAFFTVLVRRGLAATSLFVIVMYIGVLAPGSGARRYFGRMRAELAIAACILIAGHVASYLATFAQRLLSGGLNYAAWVVSLMLGLVLVLLCVPLGVTSLKRVHRAMSAPHWAKLQKLSYAFYALMYLHPALLLAPAAINGSAKAQVNLGIYTAVFGVYLVLRLLRARKDDCNLAENLAE